MPAFGPAEQQKRRDLRKMKLIPTLMLVVAAIVYLVALRALQDPNAPEYWNYLRAAGEAGMVGGLADWFAVTALFRHPLGIPIPHTALIPNKKDQLGASLSEFVQENFLTPEVVEDKVLRAEPARRVGDYLASPDNRARVVREASSLAKAAINGVKDEDVQLIIRNMVFEQAASFAWAPPAGRLLDAAVTDGTHEGLVDLTFEAAHTWLLENEAAVTSIVADIGPLQNLRLVHELVGRRVHRDLLTWTASVRDDRNHKARAAINSALLKWARELREDPLTIERVERLKHQVLDHAEVHKAIAAMWPATRRVLLDALDNPHSELRLRAADQLAEFSAQLREDPEFAAGIDQRIATSASFLVQRYGNELVTLITDTVERWDASEASERIELQVGKDLQFIRINGTVVGSLAGLLIYGVGQLIVG